MIIVVGNEKGGVGKSTLSRAFAALIAEQGADTVLVDTDAAQAQMAWAKGRAKRGLPPIFNVIGATTDVARTVARTAKTAGGVVVDIGAGDYESMREVAEIADVWIVPTRVGPEDLISTRNLCKALEGYSIQRRHGPLGLAVLVNAVPGPWNSREDVDARADLTRSGLTTPILVQSVRDRRVWRDARRANKVLGEMPIAEAQKAQEELRAVFDEVVQLASQFSREAA